MFNWYAIYVNVKHEKKVVQKLQEQQIEAYSPVVKKLQQWSDRKKWVEFPMLSGYVFVKRDITEKEKVFFFYFVVTYHDVFRKKYKNNTEKKKKKKKKKTEKKKLLSANRRNGDAWVK